MFWPDTGTGVDVEPARKPVASAVRKFFTEGGAGVHPTVPGGDWFNQITNEVMNVLTAAGIDPSKTDDDQLLQAINSISKAMSAREALRRTYAEAGYTLVYGSFELGGTLASISDVLLHDATGIAYSWDGVFPHDVDPDTDPSAVTGYVSRQDEMLRVVLAGADGAKNVGFGEKTVFDSLSEIEPSVGKLLRQGKTGIFTSAGYLTSPRCGPLAYRKQVGGQAQLLTDLSRFFPVGSRINPIPKRQVFATLTPAAFATTGMADIYRSVNADNDFWGAAGVELLQAAVIDTATGRKYADRRLYPASDYSCQVINSAAFGGLTIEIKQPAGVPAPTTIVVELSYPVATDSRAIYIDPINGHDEFDGSSFDWPMKTIPAAIAKVPAVIFLRPGAYVQTNYPGDYISAADIAIKAIGGRAQFISLGTTFSAWTVHSGSTYVSTIGGSATSVGVVDLMRVDEFGAPSILAPTLSLAECVATPGTFFYDAGPRNMYVHLLTGAVPTTTTVYPYGAANTFRHSSPTAKVYLSDIDFIGGTGGAISARDAGVNGVLITERCRFLGSYNSNGADIKDIGLSISIDCSAAYNGNDGFNYSAFNGISPHFIEIGCFGYRNMTTGTGNGTTSHDDCIGFRIGCDAAYNAGPGFADVNNSNTLSVNCTSRQNGPSTNASGFRADGAGSRVYLDGCSADSNGAADLHATDGAVLYVRDAYSVSSEGTIQPMT